MKLVNERCIALARGQHCNIATLQYLNVQSAGRKIPLPAVFTLHSDRLLGRQICEGQ